MSWLDDWLAEQVSEHVTEPWPSGDEGGTALPPPVRYAAYVPVSTELLMDAGAIPDTRPPRKPLTRRERFRWWRFRQRERIAIRAYERISGHRFPERDIW